MPWIEVWLVLSVVVMWAGIMTNGVVGAITALAASLFLSPVVFLVYAFAAV